MIVGNIELKRKIEELLKLLNKGLIGKEKVIKLTLLGVFAKENIILIGPPGTAKSEISRRITKIFSEESYFEYLLTKFTTPEEIFGPLSIKKLQEDIFERNAQGYMPTSKIVFLDEIFKANSSILNTLLAMINEKIFHNGGKRQEIPLISVIGASNELPFENEELAALYDRFLLRRIVNYVSDDDVEELMDIESGNILIPEHLKITSQDLDKIEKEYINIKLSENVKKTLIRIRSEYNRIFSENRYETISDRKFVKMIKLLKISAYINGRKKVDFSDVMLLTDCLWNNPENYETVTKVVLDIVKRNIAKETD
ncbi:AAA family ATPase [Leptotrichia sp. OH3620_COT-345]|uniref:AAA family ATPase n=1 Tax=Leptotrichia sp. OH3620_COT-345 TaxID=2491048 RepID=UPI000F6497AD|nr:AAA family ATPase [Leptotrichia sp. OH3620_COT-345]RRD39406.1 AAA family ATPase [Leptotrichia sp. OH3620_COT-345]